MAKAKRPPQTKKKLGGPRVGEGGPRQAKADAVQDIQTRFSGSSAVLLTEYRGMTVHELAELRTGLREAGADYKVYKNTLATIAVRNLGLEDLIAFFQGPTAFTFAVGDPVVAAKRLSDFAKRVPTLVLKGGLLEGKILSAREVSALGALESRDVMLAKAAGLFISPIQKAANLFAAAFHQLGSVLVQLRDNLQGEDAAPAEQAAGAGPPAGETAAGDAATEETAAAGATETGEVPGEAEPGSPGESGSSEGTEGTSEG